MLDESGATAIEYGLIVALLFLAMIGSAQLFADEANTMWDIISGTMSDVSDDANVEDA
ncbi:Flp family type IVb pilin [Aurantiacibacter aquimixticola]|uniref:Flp family type IVb pilin n=2 Tax=Aurantiacibacter aquimixticola TaxID=1958945 RepID=A0A419RWQ3_9SPHN|nr:Flp family type IVb pilin [Aurantiacibacter aquimixticola]